MGVKYPWGLDTPRGKLPDRMAHMPFCPALSGYFAVKTGHGHWRGATARSPGMKFSAAKALNRAISRKREDDISVMFEFR